MWAILIIVTPVTRASDAVPRPASQPGEPADRRSDWPMWGGRPDRNMVSDAQNLPVTWDVTASKNIKWVARLGSQTYGNLVVSGGRIFIGTNNGGKRDPKITEDKGVLMCFAEKDGRFLWQTTHDKLPEPEKHDWPDIGLCSTPCVVGDRVYYISNRAELICVDARGFGDDQNDGPFRDERLRTKHDADVIWRLDMRKELGVSPHYASASAPLVIDDLVLVVTGNGIDAETSEVPAPDAPSFIAVDRLSGKVVWQDSSPADRILGGQWASPAYAVVAGQPQVVFPGGDGWLYAFAPRTGKPLWRFNCKAPRANAEPAEDEEFNTLIATPVCHENRVFVAVGQEPEQGSGPGCLWAVDAKGSGDVTQTGSLWSLGGASFERSVSTVAIRDGLLYIAEVDGYLDCLDVDTGKRYWRHDLKATTWASPLVADGKVYLGNDDGDVLVFRHARQRELLAVNTMKQAVCSTAVAANGTLYITTRQHLYAIANPVRQAHCRPSRETTDWPLWRGDARLTGVATTPLPDEPEVLWQYETGDSVESSAAIAGGNVYVGCDDAFLYALDAGSGSFKWKYRAKGPIRSSPCVYRGTVFFGDDDGVLHAVDAGNGDGAWTYATEGEIMASPNCVEGKVLFGSYDGYLYCLDAANGKLVWRTETDGRIHGSCSVIDGKVVVAGCDERLHVFRLQDGKQTSSVEMGSFSGASAAVCGTRAYVGTFNEQVLAVDWAAGKVIWTYEHPDRHFPFYGSAAVTDQVVVIGGRDKLVHAWIPIPARHVGPSPPKARSTPHP